MRARYAQTYRCPAGGCAATATRCDRSAVAAMLIPCRRTGRSVRCGRAWHIAPLRYVRRRSVVDHAVKRARSGAYACIDLADLWWQSKRADFDCVRNVIHWLVYPIIFGLENLHRRLPAEAD